MADNLGAAFSIDITDLKSGLAQANRLIRESESEFREAASGMDDWTESEEGLEARMKATNRQVELQQAKVDALSAEKKRLISTMKAEGKTQEEIDRAVDGVNKSLTKEAKELERLKKESKKSEEALENFGDANEEAGEKSGKLGNALKGAVGAIAGVAAAAVGAVSAFLNLADSTKETQAAWDRLYQSFNESPLGDPGGDFSVAMDYASDAMYGLQGVLGDTDKAFEASNFLAKYSKDGKDLEQNVRVLTGVFAQYGESIPTEGLAEGIAATSEMGIVQGVLADALEWQGVNLEEYNEQLGKMTSAEERAAYIQETLLGIYGESADAYTEANSAMIEYNNSTMRQEEMLADLGRVAIPIMTAINNITSHLLMNLRPFVEILGEGLTGVLEGSADGAAKLAEGLSGILGYVVDLAADVLPTVISVLAELIPMLISSILDKLPDLLALITDTILPNLLDTLGVVLPQIVQKLIDIVPQLISQLLLAIPTLFEAAVEFLMAIVQALPTLIENLISSLPAVVQTIVDVILTAIPMIIDAAIELFMAIIQAIPVIIEALVQNLPTIINTIIDGLLSALPQLLEGAIELLMAIIQAIPTITQMLVKETPRIVKTVIETLISRLPELIMGAVKLFTGILDAIPTICKELWNQVPTIIQTITEGLTDGLKDVKEVGTNLLKGLWEGIKEAGAWLWKKITGFAGEVVGWFKDAFGINSPSKVMADAVGKDLARGVGVGFTDTISGLAGDMTDALGDALPSASVAVNGAGGKAFGGVNVYQTNNYSQAHSRYEIYQSKQQTAAAVKLALGGVM